MKWVKHGQIFKMFRIDNDLQTHASNPLAIHLKEDMYRIFFSARDASNKSSVGYVDIDIVNKQIDKVCDKAVFKYSSNKDSYYSDGVSIGTIYAINDQCYILFMGWQNHLGQHWRGDVGRLVLSPDKSMLSIEDENKPFIGMDEEDEISLSYPWVLKHEGKYLMWYGSTVSWTSKNGEMIHVIKYAESEDGNLWTKYGIAIPYEIGVAQAFSRPSVIKNEDGFHCWYSYRSGNGEKYRIGYAQSSNGKKWERKELGLEASMEGWDSEMMCYPFVFDHKGTTYMLYNGNDYGRDGFGLAELIKR